MLATKKKADIEWEWKDVERAGKLLRGAAEAKRALDAMKSVDVRPTAESCVGQNQEWAGLPAEHRAATRREIEGAPHRFQDAAATRRIAAHSIKEGRFTRPTREERRLAGLLGPLDGAKAELGSIGSNVFELMAICFEDAAAAAPERFGTLSAEAVERQLHEPKRRYDVAVVAAQEIPRPLLLGLAHVAGVQTEPEVDLVERLIQHLMNGGNHR